MGQVNISALNSSSNTGTNAPDKKSDFLELIDSLCWALIVVVFIRSFLVEPFKIPTGSMIPTLKVGDHILVTKFFYTLGLPLGKIKLFEFNKPKRGEVIVFLYPRDESKNYIKRVIGLPGDKIEIHDSRLYINGKIIEQQAASQADRKILRAIGSEYLPESIDLYKEFLVADKWHFTMHDRANTASFNVDYVLDLDDDGQADPIPPGNYFVMGDNRDHSADSRLWELVPEANIKGKALMVWLSTDKEQSLLSLDKIRWDSMFKIID